MVLVHTLLVRNERALVGRNVKFHLEKGADYVIVTDNGSVDGTRDLLADLEKEYPNVSVIDENGRDHDQGAWVGRMMRVAWEKYKADWAIPGDADEFWVAKQGSLKEVLAGYKGNLLGVFNVNVVQDRDSVERDRLADGYRGESFWKRREKAVYRTPLGSLTALARWRKVIVAPGEVVEMAEGNHNCRMAVNRGGNSFRMEVVHFPMGSYGDFERKVVDGARALASNRRVDPTIGEHWRQWYGVWEEGRLREEYEKYVPTKEMADSLVKRGVLREWKKGELGV